MRFLTGLLVTPTSSESMSLRVIFGLLYIVTGFSGRDIQIAMPCQHDTVGTRQMSWLYLPRSAGPGLSVGQVIYPLLLLLPSLILPNFIPSRTSIFVFELALETTSTSSQQHSLPLVRYSHMSSRPESPVKTFRIIRCSIVIVIRHKRLVPAIRQVFVDVRLPRNFASV